MSSKTSNLLSPSVLSAAGNVPQEAKEAISRMCSGLVEGPAFGQSISRRMVVTEMNVAQKPEEPRKVESRIVMELDVEEGERRNNTQFSQNMMVRIPQI